MNKNKIRMKSKINNIKIILLIICFLRLLMLEREIMKDKDLIVIGIIMDNYVCREFNINELSKYVKKKFCFKI